MVTSRPLPRTVDDGVGGGDALDALDADVGGALIGGALMGGGLIDGAVDAEAGGDATCEGGGAGSRATIGLSATSTNIQVFVHNGSSYVRASSLEFDVPIAQALGRQRSR